MALQRRPYLGGDSNEAPHLAPPAGQGALPSQARAGLRQPAAGRTGRRASLGHPRPFGAQVREAPRPG
eukprot:6038408-Lingulodinium_polyedra.AAC.1